MNCTNCGKPLNGLRININLEIKAERLTSTDVWEQIKNSEVNPQEILCKECFDKFADNLGLAMNSVVN